jgi:hypothetical protein
MRSALDVGLGRTAKRKAEYKEGPEATEKL